MCIVVLEKLPLPFHNRLESRGGIAVIISRSFVNFGPDPPFCFIILLDSPLVFFTILHQHLLISVPSSPSYSPNLPPNLSNLLPPMISLPELLQVPHDPPAKSFIPPSSYDPRSLSNFPPFSLIPGDDSLINLFLNIADLLHYLANNPYPFTYTDSPLSSNRLINRVHHTNPFFHKVCHRSWHCLGE
ncbi:hypothetical protein HOY82DRAFT_523131 [Tuber indicum]|nr:hypothetical protein HOY82DRAFT_523131 [Tuber indicum]